jgi:SPP1 gp7 family putative phage head morphogenesis protein
MMLRTAKTVTCLSSFDVTNPAAVLKAEQHAAELVTAISEESRAAINKIVQRMFVEGIPPRQAASLIKQVVGLTEQSANAVVNLHQRILENPGKLVYAGKKPIRVPAAGMSEAQLKKVTQQYADKLLRQRAMNIARTETVKAANSGQAELWRQAQTRGELPGIIKHEWIASMEERTCQTCSGLNGEVVYVGQMFSTGITLPPAHPMCRCSTGLVM